MIGTTRGSETSYPRTRERQGPIKRTSFWLQGSDLSEGRLFREAGLPLIMETPVVLDGGRQVTRLHGALDGQTSPFRYTR